jgi:hypothetical protein
VSVCRSDLSLVAAAALLTALCAGCALGPLPRPIVPRVPAARDGDSDLRKDGLFGPVRLVRTISNSRFVSLDEYDRGGSKVRHADRAGEQWFRHDARGRLVETLSRPAAPTEAAAAAADWRRTERRYDEMGRLVGEITTVRGKEVPPERRTHRPDDGPRPGQVIDAQGYLLEDPNGPGTVCRRFNEHGDLIRIDRRPYGKDCGWMLTWFQTYTISESSYQYDAAGNWTVQIEETTLVQYPRDGFPLTETVHVGGETRREITYFDAGAGASGGAR